MNEDTSCGCRGDVPGRLPEWLRVKTGKARLSQATRSLVEAHGLHTVCQSARCPNIGECYCSGTATFLILGNVCTRNCRFCAVAHGSPGPVDPDEPGRLAQAAAELGLRYVVVTSVTRDDLPDGGASQFAATVRELKRQIPGVLVEVLPSDMGGDEAALRTVLDSGPDVFNHNLETVRRLQPVVRPQAGYERSLGVLRRARELGALTKSGLIVGLGETRDELREALDDLASCGVRILTIGQYLQPTRAHMPVARYVEPAEFDEFADWGRQAGIDHVVSGPFVRSSYQAAEAAACVELGRDDGGEEERR
ncbi:MAG: lipoyl synthase [Acidobacteriota bacterium]|nr:lipoyl synthase [Acidobacteriota bacterium]